MNKRQSKRAKRRSEARRENDTAQRIEEIILPASRSRSETNSAKPTRPHALTITFTVISIIVACVALYWNIAQPDIRYVASVGPETMTVVESKADNAGNFIHSLRLRPTFTNYSMKPGFIDKAEWVPLTIATLPEIKITSIGKSLIFWHEKKQVEITFLMTVPTDPVNHLNTTRDLAMEQVLAVYDNTGRKVERLDSGLFGRIRFNFTETVKTQLTGIR